MNGLPGVAWVLLLKRIAITKMVAAMKIFPTRRTLGSGATQQHNNDGITLYLNGADSVDPVRRARLSAQQVIATFKGGS